MFSLLSLNTTCAIATVFMPVLTNEEAETQQGWYLTQSHTTTKWQRKESEPCSFPPPKAELSAILLHHLSLVFLGSFPGDTKVS